MKWLDFRTGLRDPSHYYDELESLRGWAILLVVCFHAHGIIFGDKAVVHSIPMSYISSGATGVTLFFVLSAFLLSMPYIRAGSVKRSTLGRFYLSRTLRIIPLYYLAIFVAIIMTGNFQAGLNAMAFQYIGFDMFPFSVIWWTLSTEIQFYILLPLIMWLLLTPSARIIGALILFIWLYYYYSLVLANHASLQDSKLLTLSIFGRLPAFAAGIGCAYIYLAIEKKLLPTQMNRPAWRIGGTILMFFNLVILGLVLQKSSAIGGFKSELIWHQKHIYESLCWSMILLVILCCKPYGKQLFVNPVMSVLGKLSYSIYLVHLPVQFYLFYSFVDKLGKIQTMTPQLWLLFFLSLAIIVIVSLLTYNVIEKPFLKLKSIIPTTGRIVLPGNRSTADKELRASSEKPGNSP